MGLDEVDKVRRDASAKCRIVIFTRGVMGDGCNHTMSSGVVVFRKSFQRFGSWSMPVKAVADGYLGWYLSNHPASQMFVWLIE